MLKCRLSEAGQREGLAGRRNSLCHVPEGPGVFSDERACRGCWSGARVWGEMIVESRRGLRLLRP